MNVGDYVRCVDGSIGTIININELIQENLKYAIEIPRFNDILYCGNENITKFGEKPIDVIEIDDVIAFKYYIGIKEKKKTKKRNIKVTEALLNMLKEDYDNEYHIVSILPHELIEKMEYKIEE